MFSGLKTSSESEAWILVQVPTQVEEKSKVMLLWNFVVLAFQFEVRLRHSLGSVSWAANGVHGNFTLLKQQENKNIKQKHNTVNVLC